MAVSSSKVEIYVTDERPEWAKHVEYPEEEGTKVK